MSRSVVSPDRSGFTLASVCATPNRPTVGAAQVCTVQRRTMTNRAVTPTIVMAAPARVTAGPASTPPPRAVPPLARGPGATCRPTCRRVKRPAPVRQEQARSRRCRPRPRHHRGACRAAGSPPDNHAGVGLYLIELTFRPRMRPAILVRQARRHTPPFRSPAGERAWTRSPFA